jgi:hypothetical protein
MGIFMSPFILPTTAAFILPTTAAFILPTTARTEATRAQRPKRLW